MAPAPARRVRPAGGPREKRHKCHKAGAAAIGVSFGAARCGSRATRPAPRASLR